MTALRSAAVLSLAAFLVACGGCSDTRRAIVAAFPTSYHVDGDPSRQASFDGKDAARKRIAISLGPVATGLPQVTDLQFPPGRTDLLIALQKEGEAQWVSLADHQQGRFLKLDVLTASEEGLLGLAFHPKFAENGRFFLNYVVRKNDKDMSQVEEWRVPPGADLRTAKPAAHHLVMEVEQPYQNHDAGQLAFGPDGFLYVGWGDGGFADDPHGNGQNPLTMLGDILRIDVDNVPAGKGYGIPKDNPFVGKQGFLPELWARGVRNPWRYSFGPKGELIVADVGQNKWEEIDVVTRGANLGWNVREGFHCFKPEQDCPTEGLTDPIWDYGHDEGQSITGGYVYTGKELPELSGKYVFGDFVQGRLWALDLPAPGHRVDDVYALGKWPVLPSTFGRDAAGELYLGDFSSGTIFKLVAATQATDAGAP